MESHYRNVSIHKETAEDIEILRKHLGLRSRAEVVEHLSLEALKKIGGRVRG